LVKSSRGSVRRDVVHRGEADHPVGVLPVANQLLFEIDPRPFSAALDQANAQLAVAQADLTKAETDVARDTPLAAQNAIPLKQLDNDKSAAAAGKAQVDAAKAMIEQAKLNLEWTKVYSPIDGIAGVATSQVGDLVGTSTKMTTISKVNPIRAYFSISEDAYLRVADKIAAVLAGRPDRGATAVEYIQANETAYPSKGRIILVNREVSSQTGTIQLAAEFSNPGSVLRPGGFGRVRIKTGDNKGALLVPQTSVMEIQSAYQVVVIGPDNKASFRPVKVGDRVYVLPEKQTRTGGPGFVRVVKDGKCRIDDGAKDERGSEGCRHLRPPGSPTGLQDRRDRRGAGRAGSDGRGGQNAEDARSGLHHRAWPEIPAGQVQRTGERHARQRAVCLAPSVEAVHLRCLEQRIRRRPPRRHRVPHRSGIGGFESPRQSDIFAGAPGSHHH